MAAKFGGSTMGGVGSGGRSTMSGIGSDPNYNPNAGGYSGVDTMVGQYGDWFSYERTPRAQIFRRDQGNIKDINTMTR